MSNTKNIKNSTEKLVLAAVMTALVVVLQLMGQFIHLGPFSISLVLVPIVIGAAVCGPKIGAWLGFVFGVVVLFTDAAAFLAISVPGTIVTVLLKGAVSGLAAGLVYQLLAKKSPLVAVIAAAIICPVVNTGIFLLGCVLFFFETIQGWGVAAGFTNVASYMFLGLVGGNFLVELAANIVLSPVIERILNIRNQN